MLDIVKGNILQCGAEALVNTVNTRGVMGKGIALQFKKAYKEMFIEYEKAVKNGEIVIGRMHIYETGFLHNPRYIINFPTKEDWRKPSKNEYIKAGLEDLLRVVQERKIKSIAIPPLGCGLGGLNWLEVKELVELAFSGFPSVQVWLFEPGQTPSPDQVVNNTIRPKLTRVSALILSALHNYAICGYESTWVEVQKLGYFLQASDKKLKLEYEKGNYGPYADSLRHIMNRLEGHYITGYGDGTLKPTSVMRLVPGAKEQAQEYLQGLSDTSSQSTLKRVAALIDGFETPYGLELLGTVHWLVRREGVDPSKEQEVISAVHTWSRRKANLMKPEHIVIALRRLTDTHWL